MYFETKKFELNKSNAFATADLNTSTPKF